MMKLYYAPGACSQAPHIILHELGFDHDAARVNFPSKTLDDGTSFYQVNPKGAVPALEIDSGDVLTENAAILQYLGDRSGSSDVLPPLGHFRRYRVLEWLNYVATELHKGFGPLWNPVSADEWKQATRELIAKKFDYVDKELGDGPYLMGDVFTLPDAYLFVILGWTQMHDIDLSRWPNLSAFRERMLQRPSVHDVMRFEGLLQEEGAQ
jgi:glutathione S-transferase